MTRSKRRAGRATDLAAYAAPPLRARSPAGVPLRLLPKGVFHPEGSAQARLPGTRPERSILKSPRQPGSGDLAQFERHYPPRPVPVQGCTSRPGHSAGRRDAQAARERIVTPPAGTALAPTLRHTSARRPSRASLNRAQCNGKRDFCQERCRRRSDGCRGFYLILRSARRARLEGCCFERDGSRRGASRHFSP
jgi:hypothetical protein